MDRKLLFIGGTILVVGGLGYWYLLQHPPTPPPPKCEDYRSQSECESHGCYWYSGACHSHQEGKCEHLGSCYPNIAGWQLCDFKGNLCKCDGSAWLCIEENSTICKDGIQYAKCGVNNENKVFCREYYGHGSDECNPEPGSVYAGCSCEFGECHPFAWCEPISRTCFKKAISVTLSLDDSNWECTQLNIPGHGGNVCTYTLPEPLAATKLDGMFYWKWGFWGISRRCYIDIYCNNSWERIWSSDWEWMGGDTGVVTVQAIFETAKVVEKIRFIAESNNAATNIKPSSFVGWLNF